MSMKINFRGINFKLVYLKFFNLKNKISKSQYNQTYNLKTSIIHAPQGPYFVYS